MLLIKEVDKGSVLDGLGVKPGWCAVSFDGRAADDFLDYCYVDGAERLRAVFRDKKGREKVFDIRKESWRSLGLGFYEEPVRECVNNCVFCFVDRLPRGMRESLYIKDDDYRFCPVTGNYVTLTNLCDADVDRIAAYKLSPLYVSVHAADRNIRARLLGVSQDAADVMPRLERFWGAGIVIHAQAVLCAGINDGAVLEDTLTRLSRVCKSISVVPVGLTKYGARQAFALAIDGPGAKRAIATVDAARDANLRQFGDPIVYAADELYLKAGIEIPDVEYYGAFPQIENGVGMWSKFEDDFAWELEFAGAPKYRKATLITSEDAYPLLKSLIGRFEQKADVQGSVAVQKIVNKFFGESVTVAGLITGADIKEQLGGCSDLGEAVLFPQSVLKEFTELFLDGVSVAALSRALGTPLIAVEPDGAALVRALAEVKGE
ncbi:MAG: DUF512 domain-containing protein [Firmicutes bacterium]|nr:DUF512 domain-containing protein [Bacillota bacterium]